VATIPELTNKGLLRVEKTILPLRFQKDKALNKLSSDVLIGKNVFTTLGVLNSRALFLPEHLKRLEIGHQFFFSTPFPAKELESDINSLDLNDFNSLKITVFSDFYVFTLKDTPIKDQLRLGLFKKKKADNFFPNNIKHGNYLYRLRQLEFSQKEGFDDALELDKHDLVLETSIRNIFFYDGKKLVIPSSELIFQGITIEKIKGIFDFEQRPISFSELSKFKYAMTCNSVRGIENVTQIGAYQFSLTDEIKKKYNQFVLDKGTIR